MKTRLTVMIASLLVAPGADALAQTNAQQVQNAQISAANQANMARGRQGGAQLAQSQFGAGGGFAPNAGRGGPPGAQQGGRGAPPGRGGPAGPGGRGGRGAPVVDATPPDTISEAFRAQASAVTGRGPDAHILMVTNYGWMRSTRTLKIGEEFQEGWMLKELDAGRAVLVKPDSPDKVIDLSRWTGDTGLGQSRAINANANGPTTITFGSVGTVRSSGRAPQPQPAARPQPAPARGATNTAQPAGRGGAAGGAVINVQGQAAARGGR